jgi:IclR family pca regulon transcriptional regulator
MSVSTEKALVQSVEKAVAVLDCFTGDRSRLTLTEVARLTGMTRASARRLLLTLEHAGYLESSGTLFFLGPRVLTLGFAYVAAIPWGPVALPYMKEIVGRLNETCSAAVLDADEIIYVARVPALRMTSITLGLGARVPAYCTATGHVLLAALDEAELDAYLERVPLEARTSFTLTDTARLREALAQVRQQGWAMTDQELRVGVRSVAVPLRTFDNRVLAAMNISTDVTRVDTERLLGECLPQLRQATTAISSALTAVV